MVMRSHIRKVPLVMIALALLVASCAQVVTTGDPQAGKPAPDLSLTTIDNQPIKLSDLKGKVVVLDFWAVFCGPCKESLPNLARISSDPALAARGLKVIAVDCHEDPQTVRKFLDENHLNLTVALDTDESAESAYAVNGIPNTFVIGRDGTIQHSILGFEGKATEDELDTAIDKALAAK
jgi:peroxiredoxin